MRATPLVILTLRSNLYLAVIAALLLSILPVFLPHRLHTIGVELGALFAACYGLLLVFGVLALRRGQTLGMLAVVTALACNVFAIYRVLLAFPRTLQSRDFVALGGVASLLWYTGICALILLYALLSRSRPTAEESTSPAS